MAYYKRPWSNKSATPTDPNAPKRKGNPNWSPNWKKASNVVPGSMYKPVSTPSTEQSAIFDAVVNGGGSVMIDAYAGCGKTTACVESMHRVVSKGSKATQAYIIFAKRNQEEALGKCPSSSTAKTAHAFGLQALAAHFGKIQVDKEKTSRIATALVGPDDEQAELRYMVGKGIDLGKDYLAETVEEITAIVEKHSLETAGLSEVEFAYKVLDGMRVSVQQPNIVSFSDMVYLPIKLNVNIPQFDLVYADEIQDMNLSRIELLMRAVGKGRLVGVGDEFQSIFGFSGADKDALTKVKSRANALSLPLHKTYRCGRAIVEFAKQYVPDYVAAESNSDGEVREVSTAMMMSENGARAGDFILSRTNAPTVKIAMQLLKQGRKCNIQGRDLGNALTYTIKRSKADSVVGFQSWLEEWANNEIARLSAKKRSYEHITDKQECLEAFCYGEKDLSVVKSKITAMFDDAEPNETHRIILSTIHKAKGLERSRVWRLEKSFTCKPKTQDDVIQERNIQYVSATRAIDSLFLVS